MATKLPRSSYLALAAVGWADGRMRKDEAAGLRRAAEAGGLAADELADVAQAAEDGIKIEDITFDDMSPWHEALTYALANWLAKLDGVVNTEELKSLRVLEDRLTLASAKLQAARSAAFDVACLPEGGRPDKYDFAELEARLKEKLPATFRASLPPEA